MRERAKKGVSSLYAPPCSNSDYASQLLSEREKEVLAAEEAELGNDTKGECIVM